jgi:lysophospholipase L1-like esterase
MKRTRSLLALVAAVAMVAAAPTASTASAAPAGPAHGGGHWVGAWGIAVQEPVPDLFPNWAPDGFDNQSVRQVVRVTTGGVALRLRLTNRYGTSPLKLTGATIARAGAGAAVQRHTVRPLTFRHSFATTIPAGTEILSDPTVLRTAPLDRLAVTLYFAKPTGPATQHVSAFSTSYRAAGNHLFDPSGAAFTETSDSFYFLSRVDVSGVMPAKRDLVVAFGDSITDGSFSTTDAYNTYPDELAERLVAARKPLTVINAGIGGNRVLRDSPCFGESALRRFERDVLDQPRVRTVIVMEALNDLFDIAGIPFGEDCNAPNPDLTAEQMIEGHRALIRAAHARGIRIVGGTVTPFKGNPYGLFTDQGEAVRDGLNHWILTSGEYDAVVDFAGVVADPADPDRMNPAYDGTPALHDAIHPNDTGFTAMAAAINLNKL